MEGGAAWVHQHMEVGLDAHQWGWGCMGTCHAMRNSKAVNRYEFYIHAWLGKLP